MIVVNILKEHIEGTKALQVYNRKAFLVRQEGLEPPRSRTRT